MKSLSALAYLVRDGITFNSVAPGGIYIPGTGFEDEQKRDPRASGAWSTRSIRSGAWARPRK